MQKGSLGIDISEHNGYIDFTKLKEHKIEYVLIKIGWIGNKNNHTIDKYFNEYYQKAKENGLKIGFYVYNYCKTFSAMQNACFWIENQIKGKDFDLPIFLDMEDSSIISSGRNELTEMSVYFCNHFKNLGYKTGVYANNYWFNTYLDINKLLDYKIWLAEWNSKITFNYKVDIWQFSSNYHVTGISGRVDVNKLNCDCETVNNVENPVDNFRNKEEFVEMKRYENGSTSEPVFSDTNCTLQIGYINPYGKCECLGIFNNKAIVRYPIYKNNEISNYKIGFVRWLGGVK